VLDRLSAFSENTITISGVFVVTKVVVVFITRQLKVIQKKERMGNEKKPRGWERWGLSSRL
jgi:hypothetical protein